jgi:hypothetical protein
MQTTLLRLGYFDVRTSTFGAHSGSPTGAIMDLADGTIFTPCEADGGSGLGEGIEISPLVPAVYKGKNARALGEATTRRIHNTNRSIRVHLWWSGTGGTYAAWMTSLHNLIGLCEAVTPSQPAHLLIQPGGASNPTYFTITEAHLSEVSFRELMNAQQMDSITLEMDAKPYGFQAPGGVPVTVQNQAINAGFEGPMGGGIATSALVAFADNFATTNAYAVQAGVPTLASNVYTLPAGARVAFGSPAWGAMVNWQLRFQWLTSSAPIFYLHFTDANNALYVAITGTSITLNHAVGGSVHQLATASITLTNTNFYWLRVTQYPTISGNPPMVECQLFNDTGPGSVGSAVASSHLGPVAAFDAVTALVGRPQISSSGANLPIGGNFAGVHTMSLFGPGGWFSKGTAGATVPIFNLAWDGTRSDFGMSGNGVAGTNTAPLGLAGANSIVQVPVTSFGAARVDLPPAGNPDVRWCTWDNVTGTVGQYGIPVVVSQTVGLSVALKSTGLSATSTVRWIIREINSSGTTLASDTTHTILSGTNQASWATFSTTYATTQATCAALSLELQVTDSTANSANGTVWFDNVQVWNQTTTGMTSMAWHDVRGPNSPYQMVVSGIVGDVAAPCWLGFATYEASWPQNTALTFQIGRRATSTAGAALVGPLTPSGTDVTLVLDSNSYGGFYLSHTNLPATQPRLNPPLASDAQGGYHVLRRVLSNLPQGTLNSTPINAQNITIEKTNSGFGAASRLDVQAYTQGALLTSGVVPTSATWTVVDGSQIILPSGNQGALTDLTASYQAVYIAWSNATDGTGGHAFQQNWEMWLPVDSGAIIGQLANPNGSGLTYTTQWLWSYLDGLPLAVQGRTGAGRGWTPETTALPNPAKGIGQGGSTSSVYPYINTTAGSYLTLDPNVVIGSSHGVNQLAAVIADGAGVVLPIVAELRYYPLYVWPAN